MSDFAVEVVRIVDPVEDHPNADRLSIIKIGGYVCISGKLDDGSHRYKQGDLVAYVPEGAILPDWLMKRDGYWDNVKDKPAFKRVKAKKLRGVFSQGLLVKINESFNTHIAEYSVDVENGVYELLLTPISSNETIEGMDVSEILGITKYEPVVPATMMGQMGALYGVTKKYDFESIQKKMDLFVPGENVFVTEKLHGTNIQIGRVPGLSLEDSGDWYVTSKGLGARGFNLKINAENKDNLYVKMFYQLQEAGMMDRVVSLFGPDVSVRFFGEVFGKGVQDLDYGLDHVQVAFFDIMVNDEYLSPDQFVDVCEKLNIPMVPILYTGDYNQQVMEHLRDGKDTITGKHMREGIVMKPFGNPNDHRGNRRIAKWVSADYLLRANGTEFN